jgi:hypothetical protein
LFTSGGRENHGVEGRAEVGDEGEASVTTLALVPLKSNLQT